MDLVRFFTREENIGGIEVHDAHIRVALLSFNKKTNVVGITALVEEPLPAGVITNGVVVKSELLVQALTRALKKMPTKLRFAIVTIPAESVFHRIVSFPKTVRNEKLEEAMKLTVGFQLPRPIEEVYLDWEKNEGVDANEVLLATVPKLVIDAYTAAFFAAGVRVVAVETHPMSIVRSLQTRAGEQSLLVSREADQVTVAVIEGPLLRFVRTLPGFIASDEKLLLDEIERIRSFYEAESKRSINNTYWMIEGEHAHGASPLASLTQDNAQVIGLFSKHPVVAKNPCAWFAALGAAMRGILPRKEDTIISLMPVGTEEAYTKQKALVFSEFIAALCIGFSIFMIVLYAGAWGLLGYIQQGFSERLSTLSNIPMPEDAVQLQQRAHALNESITNTQALLSQMKRWSVVADVVEQARLGFVAGISITNVSISTGPGGVISVRGVAATRDQLNTFKRALETADVITGVNLPLTSIGQRNNIAFTLTFSIKDPSLAKYQ
jgi:type IV pilus assembly protein PilM